MMKSKWVVEDKRVHQTDSNQFFGCVRWDAPPPSTPNATQFNGSLNLFGEYHKAYRYDGTKVEEQGAEIIQRKMLTGDRGKKHYPPLPTHQGATELQKPSGRRHIVAPCTEYSLFSPSAPAGGVNTHVDENWIPKLIHRVPIKRRNPSPPHRCADRATCNADHLVMTCEKDIMYFARPPIKVPPKPRVDGESAKKKELFKRIDSLWQREFGRQPSAVGCN